DDIIAFSEIERFIDTPVKFYSSGMKVRLAFSVAAYLNPDILIIDEVLAVGDAKFRNKSIKHMQKVAASGTTVLFVSHMVNQIRRICNRGIVLDKGEVVLDSGLEESIDKYLAINNIDDEWSNRPKEVQGESTGELTLGNVETSVYNLNKGGVDIKIVFTLTNTTDDTISNLRVSSMIADPFNRSVAL